MSGHDRDQLLNLAAAVADRSAVDWNEATRRHPQHVQRLERLKWIERIVAGYVATGARGPGGA